MQCMRPDVERRSLILRGVLDLCILALLEKQVVYGYELAERLAEHGLPIAGGSTYPLLARLERSGLVTSESRPSAAGPSRKYYSLTVDGARALSEGRGEWETVAAAVTSVVGASSSAAPAVVARAADTPAEEE